MFPLSLKITQNKGQQAAFCCFNSNVLQVVGHLTCKEEKPLQYNVSRLFVVNYHVKAAAPNQHFLLRLAIKYYMSVLELMKLSSQTKNEPTFDATRFFSFVFPKMSNANLKKKKKSTTKSHQHCFMFLLSTNVKIRIKTFQN